MRPFEIQTDHRPLIFLGQKKTKNARLMRWALALQQYVFQLRPIKGVENVISDALSRI